MIRTLLTVGILFSAAGNMSHAANIDKALSGTEGRRKAAENGLRQIKSKSAQDAEQVRSAYVEAASRQNGWLDLVCQAVEQGAPTASDVTFAAQTAASSLVEWVTARNRALGQPELAGALADDTKTSVARDLTDIAGETWSNNRGANEQKRTKAIADLKNRLRWTPFEEIQ